MINFFRRVHYFKTGGLTWFDSIDAAWTVTAAIWKIEAMKRRGEI